MSSNLWGSLPSIETIKVPLTILREQAKMLTELTKGVLMGRIRSKDKGNGLKAHTLEIVAPLLHNYAFLVCIVDHNVQLYPLTLEAPSESKVYQCTSEEAFVKQLATLLRGDRVHCAIAGMLAQSKSAK